MILGSAGTQPVSERAGCSDVVAAFQWLDDTTDLDESFAIFPLKFHSAFWDLHIAGTQQRQGP